MSPLPLLIYAVTLVIYPFVYVMNVTHIHETHGRSRSGGHTEGRQARRREGARMATRLRSGAERRETDTAAGREQTENRQTEKRYDIYLRERRRGKRRRDSQKRASVCVYILLNIVAWWPFIALSFIYIEGSI